MMPGEQSMVEGSLGGRPNFGSASLSASGGSPVLLENGVLETGRSSN